MSEGSHRINVETKAMSADAAVQEFRRIADLIVDLQSIDGMRVTVTGDINISVNYEAPAPASPGRDIDMLAEGQS